MVALALLPQASAQGLPGAAVVDRIDKAPPLPALRAVTAVPGAANPQAVPATGSVSTGQWTVWTVVPGNRSTATTMSMPPGGGTPLLADWNGDGVATPGRYENGSWFVTNAAVDTAQWEGHATFGGEPGDVPVVGQVDADGKADVGVFRAGTWLWQRADGTQDTAQFGQAGDIPVVGDWNGDGVDDLGVVRGGTWILRLVGQQSKPPYAGKGVTTTMAPDGSAMLLQFAFGAAGDVPIVGDWNRDGRSDPGVVRDRIHWYLNQGLSDLGTVVHQVHVLTGDQVPLVGLQPTGPGHCPTATRAGEKYGAAAAKQVNAPLTPKGTRKIAGNQEVLATVKDSLRYVMTNDLTSRLRSRADHPYYDPLSTNTSMEESIRRSANSALAAAIMATTSGWKKVNGITRQQLIDYAIWHVRSLACQHGATSPGGWGNDWQSALWAATAGQAGWLLWPYLSDYERSLVAAMVVSEAEYASARGPRYFRTRLNQELTPGDSQSDEVSWDLMAPALALAMMPDYRSAPKWRNALISMAIAAFARPEDLHRVQTVNGVRIDIRLPGTNANEDGTVTNHGIVNPDYTQNVEHLWWATSLLRSGKQPVPEALFLNADVVYRALAVVNFPSPPYAAPGGTVYAPAGQIYYPMGVSWGVRRPATFTGVDAFAAQYAAPDTNAAAFLAAHARDTRALQLRWRDGHIYADGNTEESYKLGKEEYALQQMALAWWAAAVGRGTHMVVDRNTYPGLSLGVGTPLP